jgi:RecA/RadA recombinase
MDFLNNIIKVSGNQYASTVDDGLDGSDVSGHVDTGSYILNALLSGSIYKGMPDNKIVALAGESATGKTYFSLGIVKRFLDDNASGVVLYFDSEQAVTSEMFKARGIDPKRVAVFPVATVEEFRRQVITVVDKCLEMKETERKPMFIVLDSLGMLSTEKEMNDTAEGKNVRDMTRAQVVKSTFRVLTLKLGVAKIPMLMTNHTYDVVGCLSDDVNVLMEDGTRKNISDIVVGDRVETMGGSSSVTELFSYDVDEVIEVELSDGTTFFATPNHKFMTRDGSWKPISDIGEGEDILVVEEFAKS